MSKAAGAAGVGIATLLTIGVRNCDNVGSLFVRNADNIRVSPRHIEPSPSMYSDDVYRAIDQPVRIDQRSADDAYRWLDDLESTSETRPLSSAETPTVSIMDEADMTYANRTPGANKPTNSINYPSQMNLDYLLDPTFENRYIQRKSSAEVLDDFNEIRTGAVDVEDYSLCISSSGIKLNVTRGGASFSVDPMDVKQSVSLSSGGRTISVLNEGEQAEDCKVDGEICVGPMGISGSMSACGATIGYSSSNISISSSDRFGNSRSATF